MSMYLLHSSAFIIMRQILTALRRKNMDLSVLLQPICFGSKTSSTPLTLMSLTLARVRWTVSVTHDILLQGWTTTSPTNKQATAALVFCHIWKLQLQNCWDFVTRHILDGWCCLDLIIRFTSTHLACQKCGHLPASAWAEIIWPSSITAAVAILGFVASSKLTDLLTQWTTWSTTFKNLNI